MNAYSISFPCISLSQFSCLFFIICLSLSFSITHKLHSVLSVLYQPDTDWLETNTYLFKLEIPLSLSGWAYTLAISFHLCIRPGVSLASFVKGRMLLLVLDELNCERAAEDRVVKWDCWLFSKCNDAIPAPHFLNDQNSSVFHSSLKPTFLLRWHFILITFAWGEWFLEFQWSMLLGHTCLLLPLWWRQKALGHIAKHFPIFFKKFNLEA